MSNEIIENKISNVKFDDVIGNENVKERLSYVLDYIKNPSYYNKFGVSTPKGILISGKPGMGKTMISEAFINESGLPYYVIRFQDNDDFISKVEEVFKVAYNNAPCIILLDDLDKFSDVFGDNSKFNSIQSFINDVNDRDVYVIATANDKYILPKSLLRNGRFDIIIDMSDYTEKENKEIIMKYLNNKCLDKKISIDDIISLYTFYSPAQIKTMINKAAMSAAYLKKNYIEMVDFVETFSNVSYLKYEWKKDENIKEKAFHECGHALVFEVFFSKGVGLISILTSNDAEGKTKLSKKVGRDTNKYNIACLAGKVCVELNMPVTASGCSDDLRKVKFKIYDDLGENGSMAYEHITINNEKFIDNRFNVAASEKLVTYEKAAKYILIRNRDLLMDMVDMILEKGYILRSDLDMLISKHPIDRSTVEGII